MYYLLNIITSLYSIKQVQIL